METSVTYNGTCRQTAFGFVLPEFVPVEGLTLDVINLPHNCVPLKLENGVDYTKILPDESIDTLCLVFKIHGIDHENFHRVIADYMKSINTDEAQFHMQWRAMMDDYGNVRTIYFRIYRNEDFECKEHPEMLLGTPHGMYPCPVCMEMQVAGTMHMGAEA